MPIDHRTHREATVERGVTLAAFVVICEGATVKAGATVGALAYIGPGVTVGEGATIGPHAVVLADVPDGGSVGAAEVWRGAQAVTVSVTGPDTITATDVLRAVKRGRR